MNPFFFVIGVLLVLAGAGNGYAAAWDRRWGRAAGFGGMFVAGVLSVVQGLS